MVVAKCIEQASRASQEEVFFSLRFGQGGLTSPHHNQAACYEELRGAALVVVLVTM